MTTPQEPRDDDEPTMLPEAYLEQQPDGSTRPMAQDPTNQEPSVQDPYAQPQYGQPQYGQAYGGQPVYGQDPSGQAGSTPAYGYGYAAPPQKHPSAQTAMVLGLVGLVGFFLCGITLVLSPFAWRMGRAPAERSTPRTGRSAAATRPPSGSSPVSSARSSSFSWWCWRSSRSSPSSRSAHRPTALRADTVRGRRRRPPAPRPGVRRSRARPRRAPHAPAPAGPRCWRRPGW